MLLPRRLFTGILAAGLGLAGLVPAIRAQSGDTDEAGVGWRPIRGQWEDRVVQSNSQPSSDREHAVTRPVYRQASGRESPSYGESQPRSNEYRSASEMQPRMASMPPSRSRVPNMVEPSAMRGSRMASTERPGMNNSWRSPSIRVAQREPAPMGPEPEAIPPGDIQYEPIATQGPYAQQSGGCSRCGGGGPAMGGGYGGGCGDCGDDSGDECGDCGEYCGPCFNPFLMMGPRSLAIFAGVEGFKGPRDRGRNGNFGFTEGVNWGAPLGDPWGCGYQLGFAATQSNFAGDQVIGPDGFAPINPTNDARTADRHQYFFTAGIFRRADFRGLEWGVVFDILHDTFYEATDVRQIRSECGWQFSEFSEIGYSGAYRIGSDTIKDYYGRNIDGKLDPTDQFVGFYRRYFENGGEGRIWGGATGEGDGLVGADCWVPLGRGFALQSSFNYLIPKLFRGNATNPNTNVQTGGQIDESWNLGINLVWYPCKPAQCQSGSCYRPLLNVADNGQFMVKEHPVPAPAPQ
jgi:hypothetical protein